VILAIINNKGGTGKTTATAPRSYGAEDYLNLCKEILKRRKI